MDTEREVSPSPEKKYKPDQAAEQLEPPWKGGTDEMSFTGAGSSKPSDKPADKTGTVSYTHLTLPTICSV
eukprot:10922705-Prorocentrum_lima.AAC.2